MGEMTRYCASCVRRLRTELLGLSLRAAATALALGLLPAHVAAFESGRADFSVSVNDLEIPYHVFGIYVLPGETLELKPHSAERTAKFELTIEDAIGPSSTGAWLWTAPGEAGVITLGVLGATDRIDLNIVVLVPSSAVVGQRLNGYRLGNYPSEPLHGNPLYLPPDGYIELTERDAALAISPHFKLGQFPSKQSGAFPKYLVLREQLLLKLELLLEQVNHEGIVADSLTIMSGYRTPYYNAAIKNVPYSRHVYGGAADIFIDVSARDDVMDDLNADGRLNYRDAQYLYRIADRLFSNAEHASLRGGLGVYRANSAHGPFLHVDARQQRARWGVLP